MLKGTSTSGHCPWAQGGGGSPGHLSAADQQSHTGDLANGHMSNLHHLLAVWPLVCNPFFFLQFTIPLGLIKETLSHPRNESMLAWKNRWKASLNISCRLFSSQESSYESLSSSGSWRRGFPWVNLLGKCKDMGEGMKVGYFRTLTF